ncbi:MAG: glycine cleavage system protein H [Candidatus Eremiobacteraeota bacterium]|nr:glycine cleavage system protein H [Candidatus Eremiobacteraeota bacterium]
MQIEGYDFPDGILYHGEHAWARIESPERVIIGMNDFFQKSAGEIVYVDLPFEDDEVEKGETCGKIQSGKWVGKLVAPLSGVVTEVNSALEDDPSLINKSPYGDGWIAVIKPSALEEAKAELLATAAAIESWLRTEIQKAEELKKR